MGAGGRYREVLELASALASDYFDGLHTRHVGAREDADHLIQALGRDLASTGQPADRVLKEAVDAIEPGLVASGGARYFGFVIGGTQPVSVGADLMVSAWDQNAALHATSPAAAALEDVAGRWVLQLLGLPTDAGFGLPGGAGLANFVGLATARHTLLEREGWDVEERGLYGAPEITVLVGADAHVSVSSALQYLGLGRERVVRVPTDHQGSMRGDALEVTLGRLSGPIVVCSQAGNVDTGCFDPFVQIADLLAARPNAWHHVDGAFGLWAAASARHRHLVEGVERADSWATDAHKLLNVGYDCGFVASRHPESQRAAMSRRAPYLVRDERQRDNWDWVPDGSRRARGFPLYAVLRSLGTGGVEDLVDRVCARAGQMAERLREVPGIEILNDIVFNQVLVRFLPDHGDADQHTRSVVRRVQDEGTTWLSGSTWRGMATMRISVCNWATSEDDIRDASEAIIRAHQGR